VNAVVRDGGGPYRARESDRSSARPLEQRAPAGGLHWRKSPQLCDFPLRSLRIGLVLCGSESVFYTLISSLKLDLCAVAHVPVAPLLPLLPDPLCRIPGARILRSTEFILVCQVVEPLQET
jgi:hypothetical protein